jgi:hypothetical protein
VNLGVTAVYDQHSRDLEKRAALDFWEKRQDEIVSQAKQGVGMCGARVGPHLPICL